jgi:glycosyltransferase involved in cell wall biosynthesis
LIDQLRELYSSLRLPQRPYEVAVRFVTHNVVDYVDEAMTSILAQTNVDVAIIVFDDKSEDGTFEKLQEYENQFPDRVFLSSPVTNTFESGLRELSVLPLIEVHAEFLAFLDGDDYWTDPGKLSLAISQLRRPGTAIFVHAIDVVGADSHSNGFESHWSRWNTFMNSSGWFHALIRRQLVAYPTNSMVIRFRDYPFQNFKEVSSSETPDLLIKVYAAQFGEVIFYPRAMAALRIRRGSAWAPLSSLQKINLSFMAAALAKNMWGKKIYFRLVRHTLIWATLIVFWRIFWNKSE